MKMMKYAAKVRPGQRQGSKKPLPVKEAAIDDIDKTAAGPAFRLIICETVRQSRAGLIDERINDREHSGHIQRLVEAFARCVRGETERYDVYTGLRREIFAVIARLHGR